MTRSAFKAAALALLLAAGAAAVPAQAHHSAAAFDRTKPINVTGVVKQFKWANPHTWIYLVVPNGKGGDDVWELEGASVSILARNGWTAKALAPGDKIKVLVARNKDGSKGGEFLSVTKADGTVLKFGVI